MNNTIENLQRFIESHGFNCFFTGKVFKIYIPMCKNGVFVGNSEEIAQPTLKSIKNVLGY